MDGLALEQSETNSPEVAPVNERQHSDFWVCASNFFSTVLIVSPGMIVSPRDREKIDRTNGNPPIVQEKGEPDISDGALGTSELVFYDCDGALVNTVTIQYPTNQTRLIEIDPLIDSCKPQAGIRHAHLHIVHPSEISVCCRLQSRDSACIVGAPQLITDVRRICFPISFSEERRSLICLVNYGQREAGVRGKLFIGRRAPEATWSIPAFGSRIVEANSAFMDFVDVKAGEQMQGYLRLSVRGDDIVGAHLIEQSEGLKDTFLYSSLC